MFNQTPSKILFIRQIFPHTIIILLFLLLAAPSPLAYAEPSTIPSSCGNPIGILQTATHTVSISSCRFGLTFTIHTQEGYILADNLLMNDLVAGFPDLAKNISNGLAGNDARLMTTK